MSLINSFRYDEISWFGSTNYFYPLVFPADTYVRLAIASSGSTSSHPINRNIINFEGWISGWTDTPDSFAVKVSNQFDQNEISIYAIYSTNQSLGACIYLRGGLGYTIDSNCEVKLYTDPVTIGSTTFPILNLDGSEYLGSFNNAILRWTYTDGEAAYGGFLSGAQGVQGIKGDIGSIGTQGPAGSNGSNATVTWSNIVSLFNANGFTLSNGNLRASGTLKAAGGFFEE